MFRQMRRFKQQLPNEECIEILKNEVRGTLAVLGDDDYPYCLPVNYYFLDGKIYIHGAKEGHKIESVKKHDKVSFCTYGTGVQVEGKRGLDYRSVIVFGRIKILEDREKTLDICRKLSSKFNFGDDYIEDEIKKFAKVVTVLELTPEHITGKLVNES